MKNIFSHLPAFQTLYRKGLLDLVDCVEKEIYVRCFGFSGLSTGDVQHFSSVIATSCCFVTTSCVISEPEKVRSSVFGQSHLGKDISARTMPSARFRLGMLILYPCIAYSFPPCGSRHIYWWRGGFSASSR